MMHDHPNTTNTTNHPELFVSDGPNSRNVLVEGGCNGEGYGIWRAIVTIDNGQMLQSDWGTEENTTHIRMVLRAAIEGLRLCSPRDRIVVYSTLELLPKTMNGKYSVKKNLDLWGVLRSIARERDVKWIKE